MGVFIKVYHSYHSFGSCLGLAISFERFVRHQSNVPVSLVSTLMIWVRPVTLLVVSSVIPVLVGLNSPLTRTRPSG